MGYLQRPKSIGRANRHNQWGQVATLAIAIACFRPKNQQIYKRDRLIRRCHIGSAMRWDAAVFRWHV